MNTPSHSILNLAILGRPRQPEITWPILIGSWLPDVALFVFYGWSKLAGLPEAVIWEEAYYRPHWQNIFAVGNSLPLALTGGLLAAGLKRPRIVALCASIALHHIGDLPVHHDDAHQHFWPLTDFRFISPLSYWNKDHFGTYVSFAEMIAVIAASILIARRTQSRWGRGLLASVGVFYIGFYVAVYL